MSAGLMEDPPEVAEVAVAADDGVVGGVRVVDGAVVDVDDDDDAELDVEGWPLVAGLPAVVGELWSGLGAGVPLLVSADPRVGGGS